MKELIPSALCPLPSAFCLSVELAANNTTLEAITSADLHRVNEILEQYADSQLDFVDATIIAIAERENITRILTLDHRDFTLIRPRHCDYFEILP